MAQGKTVVEASGLTVTVITEDRPGLFARVSGVLAIEGLEVRAADATSVDGMALEIFQVTSRFGSLIPWDRITSVRVWDGVRWIGAGAAR